MARFTQVGRPMMVSTPLGDDVLLLERFSGVEAVSELFEFDLDLIAEPDEPIPFDGILGQSVTIGLFSPIGNERFINGIVSRFAQGAEVRGVRGDITFVRYRATVVPHLWTLTKRHQSRIFQQLAIPEILKQVFDGLDVVWRLQGRYEPRDYCVQYQETDFAFASRLMEEEGIYYYFVHDHDSHRLVVADTPRGHVPVPAPCELLYETVVGGTRAEDRITGWVKTQEVRAGKQTLWDHCFEIPGQNLQAISKTVETVEVGGETHRLKVAGNEEFELYEYPGGFAQRFDGISPGGGERAEDVKKIFEDNIRTARIRMEQEAVSALNIAGESTCRQLTPGHEFVLEGHFNADGEYILTRVSHVGSIQGGYHNNAEQEEPVYLNTFQAIPKALPFRPRRSTPKARVAGLQTAVVVGTPGEEIFTDKYGRVKVQFPWDRQGQFNADSSCWVRVSQVHAGKKWGGIDIPRIGEEVVVDFEEGDPDRPLIIGRVYNAEVMPPFDLPKRKMVTGQKTNTYPKGGGNNEISMDDTKGKERMFLNAQYDQDTVVGNNRKVNVGVDSTEEIGNNETLKVGNNQSLEVGVNQSVKVGTDQTISAGSNISINAGTSITLQCGASRIHMNQAGFITISGTVITVAGAANLAMTAPLTEVVGGVMLSAVGGVTLVEGGVTHIGGAKLTTVTSGGQVEVKASGDLVAKGALIKLNG